MKKFTLGIITVLLTIATGCYAGSTEAPYKRGKDFDPANMEHLLFQYNKATNEQKSIAMQNIDSMEQLKKNKKWTSLYKTARGLLWAYPTPEALIYLGDAYLNTGVDGKDKRELIHNKKMNFITAKSYYSIAFIFSEKVNMPISQLADQTRVKIACINEYIESEKFTDVEKCQTIVSVLADNKISI